MDQKQLVSSIKIELSPVDLQFLLNLLILTFVVNHIRRPPGLSELTPYNI